MSTVIKIVGQITLKALTDVRSTTYYYLLQSSMAAAPSKPTTNPPTGGWSTTEPEFFIYMPTQDTTIISGKDYYTRSGEEGSYIYTKVLEPSIDDISNYYEKIYGDTRSLYVTVQTLYTDDTFDYSEPSLSSSYEAAKEAYNRAKTALDLAGDTNQYFWSLSSSYSTDVPAGVYVTHIPQSQFKSTPAQGNVLMQNTGLTIRNGAIALASLTGNALNFYSPTTHNSAVQLSGQALNFYSPSDDRLALSLDSSGLNFYGSSTVNPDASLTLNGLMLKKGGIKAGTDRDNGFVYLSSEDYQLKDATHNGLTINGHTPTAAGTDGKTVSDPAWREIIGTKFAVDSDGNLYANNVDISGKIIATEGQIGGWNIGTDTNKSLFYGNQVPGAASNNLVISSNSAENTIPIAGSELNKTWFLTAGRQFGVDTNGILYASGANIQGKITVTSGSNVYTKTEADAAYDAKGAAQTAVDGIEIGGRNLLIGTPNFHLTNGSVLDTKTNFLLYVWTTPGKTYSGYKSIMPAKVYSSPGHITETFVAQNDSLSYFCIKHNGTKHDYNVFFDAPTEAVKAGETYTLSFDIVGANPSVENGLDVKNFKLERGNRATDWTPAPEDLAATATNYITKIDERGITIHPEDPTSSNYLQINSDGISINTTKGTIAKYGESIRLGDSSTYLEITSNIVEFFDNKKLMAKFGYDEIFESYGVQGENIFIKGAGNALRLDNNVNGSYQGQYILETRANGHLSLKPGLSRTEEE